MLHGHILKLEFLRNFLQVIPVQVYWEKKKKGKKRINHYFDYPLKMKQCKKK